MRRLADSPTRVLAALASGCIAVLMLLTVVDVIRRNLTGRALPGTVEYSELLMVALVFLGLATAQRRKDHVAVNIVTSRLPPRTSRIIQLVGYSVVLLFIVWMAWETAAEAVKSLVRGEVRIGLQSVVVWPARVAIPLGLTALTLQLLADVVDLVRPVDGRAGSDVANQGTT